MDARLNCRKGKEFFVIGQFRKISDLWKYILPLSPPVRSPAMEHMSILPVFQFAGSGLPPDSSEKIFLDNNFYQ